MKANIRKAFRQYFGHLGVIEDMPDTKLVDFLRQHGLIVPTEHIEHQELIERLHREMANADRDKVIESFLSGLENGEPHKRAVLSAYAIMQHFPPAHEATSVEGVVCRVCGAFLDPERDFTSCNGGRYTTGSITSGDPQSLYFTLRELNRAEPSTVTSVAMLRAVLAVIRASAPADTPTVLERRIRQIPNIGMNQEESRGLLELLGHCGILQTPEHRGFQERFTYLGLAPRKSRSSDWCYPVDWWKGEYGVDENAVALWFGKYLGT